MDQIKELRQRLIDEIEDGAIYDRRLGQIYWHNGLDTIVDDILDQILFLAQSNDIDTIYL